MQKIAFLIYKNKFKITASAQLRLFDTYVLRQAAQNLED